MPGFYFSLSKDSSGSPFSFGLANAPWKTAKSANRVTLKCIAKTFFGLEEVLSRELEQLGARSVEILRRAVAFEGDQALLYRANLQLRTTLRILTSIHQFRARQDRELYNGIYQYGWHELLKPSNTLAVDAVIQSTHFKHSKYVALKTKDAIVDQLRTHYGRRPNVDTRQPDLRVHIHIAGHQVNVLLDSSGDSLHKRGYRLQTQAVPINEALAAGMILLSNWQADRDFIDPMCGSGTLPIEAAMIARNIPPQWHRRAFGFQRWRDYDESLWQTIKEEAGEGFRPFSHQIMGTDHNAGAIRLARQNARLAGVPEQIHWEKRAFEDWQSPERIALLIMNPPYDERLRSDSVQALYKMIGDQLKQHFTGCEAWILSSNMSALKSVGLRAARKMVLFNGSLECKFQQYEMYAGSKKKKYSGSDQTEPKA